MQIKEDKIEEMEFDILTEIGNIGAGNATTALAKLINGRVDMYVPKVELLAFKDLAEILGGAEELVAGILLSLDLVHRLMGSDGSDVTDEFTEMELSALLEIGNIIAGAYLTAISQLTNLSIIPTVPSLAVDMAGAILSVPAIEFGKLGDKALLIESQFRDEEMDVCGYFILIPTMESYAHILNSLGM